MAWGGFFFLFFSFSRWEREDEGLILLGIRGKTLDQFLLCVVGEEARYGNFIQAIPPHFQHLQTPRIT